MREQLSLPRRILFFSKQLLEWHKHNTLSFPWRNTREPYRVLLSEILLRKTTREQVRRVFPAFVAKYPTAESLSEANPDDIKSQIATLGMEHTRARLLREIAESIVASGGEIPLDKNKLLQLPGVGEYVANAVLCFSLGIDVPLVDTNAIRVMQRVFSIKSHKARPREDKAIWSFVASLIPAGKGRLFNVALLDFAAAVCAHREPRCTVCPVSSACDYYRRNRSRRVQRNTLEQTQSSK